MALDIANKNTVGRVAGKAVLFIGNRCRGWSQDQWAYAARVARAAQIDTICAKVANGTEKWYGTKENLIAIYKEVAFQGCGFIPMIYSYGPAISSDFVDGECAVLTEMQEAISETQENGIGFACADLEQEYNGRIDAAQRFSAAMQNKHLLYLTSWADPRDQNWTNILNILRNCFNAFIPQAYNNYLSSTEYQQVAQDICIQSGVDLSYEFGSANDPAAIARTAVTHGQTTIWMWEYSFLGPYRSNVSGVIEAVKGVQIPASDPVSPPQPTQNPVLPPVPTQKMASITFREGDSLSGNVINEAHTLGFEGSTWQDLYASVKQHLDEVAQAHGQADSQSGNDIYIGDTITFPVR